MNLVVSAISLFVKRKFGLCLFYLDGSLIGHIVMCFVVYLSQVIFRQCSVAKVMFIKGDALMPGSYVKYLLK